MGKIKTNKAIAKRFKVTKTGKVLKRTAGQGHYNSREDGNTGRNKKIDVSLSKSYHKVVKQNIA